MGSTIISQYTIPMNKKITPKIFFTVLWEGIKNGLAWMFGYKDKSGFWRVITAMITFCLLFFTIMCICILVNEKIKSDEDAWSYVYPLSENVTFKHPYRDSNEGVVYDKKGRTLLTGLEWLTRNSNDSIAVFAKEGYRGYLNVNTGKVIVNADKYTEAYVFSEGRALALTADSVYILDVEGKTVGKPFKNNVNFNTDIRCFHGGYLPMVGEDGKMGLVDVDAHWALEPEYDHVTYAIEQYWLARKDEIHADGEYSEGVPASATILDGSLRVILQGDWSYVWITREEGFFVAGADHWQRRYGYDGQLKDDFVCDRIEHMSYTTGEKQWVTFRSKGEYDDNESVYTEERDVTGNASMLKYVTSNGWEGLMSPDGKPVTAPLYWSIQAVGKNLFLCKYDKDSADHGILLNEKGQVVK